MKYTVMTIIKNEHRYLDEWIKYHFKLGINTIIIFEDLDSESHKDICDKYDNIILKSVKIFNHKSIKKINQINTFRMAVNYIHTKFETDWLFYIDVDEFLTLENGYSSLDDVFNLFTTYPGVRIQSQNYNANGHIYAQNNVIESYTEKCKIFSGKIPNRVACKLAINFNMFEIANKSILTHHIMKGYIKTDFDDDMDKLCYDKIYIRHYVTKSFEDWVNKIYTRGQFFGSKKFDDFFMVNPQMDKKQLQQLVPKLIVKNK